MLEVKIVLTSAAGERRRLPASQITSLQWSEIRYGGFADFTMELAASITDLTTIVATDIIHVFINGVERYRGEVTGKLPREGEPSGNAISGYGRMLRVGAHIARRRYLYFGGADLSRPFSDLVHDFVLPLEPGLTISAQTIGQTTDTLDAFNVKTKDILDSLTKLAGNRAVWGVDVNTDPGDAHFNSDEAYIRPCSTTADYGIPVSALRVTSAQAEERTDQLVNVIQLIGGSPTFPNLLYNASFERPVFGGSGIGNLLLNPGFETGSLYGADNWTGLAIDTGSAKTGGHDEGGTYAGNRMVELDHVGEYVSQTRDNCGIIPGNTYTFAAHVRRQYGVDNCTAKMEMTWRTSAGAVISTDTVDGTVIAPVGSAWVYYYKSVVAPATAAGFNLKCTLLTASIDGGGGGHSPGLLWDELEVYNTQIANQDGWALVAFGDAGVNAQNWLSPTAYDGGYSVYVNQHSTDVDNHDIHLQMANNGRFPVTANQELRFGIWVKSPPGVTANGKMLLEIHTYDNNGAAIGTATKYVIPAGGGFANWTFFSTTRLCESNAAKAEAYLTFRGNGEILTDAWAVRDSGAWDGNPVNFFIPDGPFQVTLRASELMPAGTPEQLSAATYGEWSDLVTESSITNLPDAQSYGKSIFAFKATPPLSPVIELVDDTRIFRCGQGVALIGPQGPTLSKGRILPIVKITHHWDGMLRTTLELDNPKPDQGDVILAKINKIAALGNVAGANSYSSSSSGGSAITTGAGVSGSNATVAIGTVTTGAAGSAATVVNVGTPSAVVLNLSIPVGAAGGAGTGYTLGTAGQTAHMNAGGTAFVTDSNLLNDGTNVTVAGSLTSHGATIYGTALANSVAAVSNFLINTSTDIIHNNYPTLTFDTAGVFTTSQFNNIVQANGLSVGGPFYSVGTGPHTTPVSGQVVIVQTGSQALLSLYSQQRILGPAPHMINFYDNDGNLAGYFDNSGALVTGQYKFVGGAYIWSPNGDGSIRLNASGNGVMFSGDFMRFYSNGGGFQMVNNGSNSSAPNGFSVEFQNFVDHTASFGYRIQNAGVTTYQVNPNGLIVAKAMNSSRITKSTAYTLTATDSTCLVTGTTTITLPSGATAGDGHQYTIKNIGGGVVTLSGTVDGTASPTLAAGKYIIVVSDGTSYYQIGGN